MVVTRSKLDPLSKRNEEEEEEEGDSKPSKKSRSRSHKIQKNFVITIAPPPKKKSVIPKSPPSEDDEEEEEESHASEPNTETGEEEDDSEELEENEEEEEFELPPSIMENALLRKKAEEIIEYIRENSPSLETILTAKMRKKHKAELFEWFLIYENAMPMSEERMILRRQVFKMIKSSQKEYVDYKKHKKDIRVFEENHENHNDLSDMQYDILRLETSASHKQILYRKFSELREKDDMDEEFYKLKTWLRQALLLPFDRIKRFPVYDNMTQHLVHVKEVFDQELYGMEKVKEQLLLFIHGKIMNPDMKGCCLGLVGEPGVGKCLHPMTEVIMYDGTIRCAQDIQMGDLLMGDDSTPRKIHSLCRGRQLMYKIHQQNGDPYIVNSCHILTLYHKRTDQFLDMSIEEYLQLSPSEQKEYYGVKAGVEFPKRTLSFPSIPVRRWGQLWAARIGSNRFLFPSKTFHSLDFPFLELIADDQYRLSNDANPDLIHFLRDQDFLHYIPDEFSRNQRQVRLEFVRGVLDICGLVFDSQYMVFLRRSQMDDFIFICRSLGLLTRVTRRKAVVHFLDPWKQLDNEVLPHPLYLTYEISLQKLDVQDYVGFIIDQNHRFLLKDFTVTHNTSIARCLAKVLDFPFEQISFGGVNHADFIKGFDFTYVGSRPGEVVRCLTRMKYKNGIIFLDEYEKVSQNPEIISTLLHITDFSQNNTFRDNYFNDLTIDLSAIWFIYSMNELPQDKALRDRIYSIQVEGYSEKEKIRIASDYLFPKNLANIGKQSSDVVFDDSVIRYMVQKICVDEKGIRNLEKGVKDILNKINFVVTNQNKIACSFQLPDSCYPLSFPVTLTNQMIDIFLKDFSKESSTRVHHFYM